MAARGMLPYRQERCRQRERLSQTGGGCNVPRAMREEGRTLASVDRALALLDALAELPSGARVGELAQRTAINQSTVSRLLGTLMARGFVDRDDATARYRLGPAPGRLRGRRARRPRRAGDRAAAPRAPRRADGGDRDAVGPRGDAAVHDRLRPEPVERRQPGRARPAQRHACDGHREAPARLRPAAARAPRPEPYERFTDRTLTTRAELGARGRSRARRRRGVRSRGARGRPQRRRGGGARPRAGARGDAQHPGSGEPAARPPHARPGLGAQGRPPTRSAPRWAGSPRPRPRRRRPGRRPRAARRPGPCAPT